MCSLDMMRIPSVTGPYNPYERRKMSSIKLAEVLDKRSKFFGKKGQVIREQHGAVFLKFPSFDHVGTVGIYFPKTEVKIIEITKESEKECANTETSSEVPNKLEPVSLEDQWE